MKYLLCAMLAFGFSPLPSLAQHSKQFIQAELLKTIKAKSAKAGDVVKARTVNAVILPGGVTLPEGTILLGGVRAASPASLAISFEQAELAGKKTPVNLSIRAAMMPNGPPSNSSAVVAQTGSIIGMPGVTLQVDDSPQHASKFESSGKDLQLRQGLALMLATPE
jgi:hypothetical protein